MLYCMYRQSHMTITTLEATTYKGKHVYIRMFKNMFEYLVIIDDQLYTTHMVVNKTPLQALLGRPYTKKQLEDITKYLKNMAEATIEHVTQQSH